MRKKIKQIDIEELMASKLRQIREYFINEPTIFYNVGDEVVHGNIEKTTITEVIDDGKIYKVHEILKNNNYGNPYFSERDEYLMWNDLRPKRVLDTEMFYKENDLQIQYSQREISSLFNTYYTAGIDDEMDYQRGNVWELKDKQTLIRSIFEHIDIGKFAFIQRSFKSTGKLYEILDGKQRMNALIEYFENRYEFNGKRYYDLHERDKTFIRQYPVSWGEVKTHDGNISHKQKCLYFLRLNTCGKPQDQKHLENVQRMAENEV